MQVQRQLIAQMTVLGRINPQRFYFFAVDTSGNTANGPVPVFGPPWGNGWGAGSITHFVRVDNFQPNFYGLYRFELDDAQQPNLIAPIYLGTPLTYSPVQDTSTLSFALDLDELRTPGGTLPNEITVNFIATDLIPVDPNFRGNKLVDALGRSGNNTLTLNVQSPRIYRNSDASEPETGGDVPDPDIDIIDWQIEVRSR